MISLLIASAPNHISIRQMDLVQRYIEGVQSGEIVTGKLTQLAVQRHCDDLNIAEEKGWYFDEAAAGYAVECIGEMFEIYAIHTRKNIELQPWQAFIIAVLFGWMVKATGYRRFKKAYIEVARKNGKSFLAAAIGLFMLLYDDEHSAEIYSAALKRDQAKKVFTPAKSILRAMRTYSKLLKKSTSVLTSRLVFEPMEGYFEPLSRDANAEEGSNPHLGIVDEYHVHPTSYMLGMLESGNVQRMQALILIITTAGFDLGTPCYELHKVAVDVLQGKSINDSTFFIIFNLDKDDDFEDESTWAKANPNLNVGLPIQNFREKLQQVQSEGIVSVQNFKVKQLNYWLNEALGWISHDTWMLNHEAIDMESLEGRACYVGIDLASTQDLTAVCYLFPPLVEGERAIVLWDFYCPEIQITEPKRNDGQMNYQNWYEEGYIKSTPGNVTDYRMILDEIVANSEKYNIMHIGYDRHRAINLIVQLEEMEIDTWPVPMTFGAMTVPMEQIERWLFSEKFNHGNNPIANWMLSNIKVLRQGNDYKRIDKKVAKGKIDGFIALINSVAVYLQYHHDDENTADLWFNVMT